MDLLDRVSLYPQKYNKIELLLKQLAESERWKMDHIGKYAKKKEKHALHELCRSPDQQDQKGNMHRRRADYLCQHLITLKQASDKDPPELVRKKKKAPCSTMIMPDYIYVLLPGKN